MASIKVKLKNGEIRDFPHVGRTGGSYTKKIRYEGGFAIIEDEWGKEIAIPSENIEEIEVTPTRW